jgi:hypothetical protein
MERQSRSGFEKRQNIVWEFGKIEIFVQGFVKMSSIVTVILLIHLIMCNWCFNCPDKWN